jgi:hypothetical protein
VGQGAKPKAASRQTLESSDTVTDEEAVGQLELLSKITAESNQITQVQRNAASPYKHIGPPCDTLP